MKLRNNKKIRDSDSDSESIESRDSESESTGSSNVVSDSESDTTLDDTIDLEIQTENSENDIEETIYSDDTEETENSNDEDDEHDEDYTLDGFIEFDDYNNKNKITKFITSYFFPNIEKEKEKEPELDDTELYIQNKDPELYELIKYNDSIQDKLLKDIVDNDFLSKEIKNDLITKCLSGDKHDKERNIDYIKKVLALPIGKYKSIAKNTDEEINEFLLKAKKEMDKYIHGLHEVKEELLDFLVKIAKNDNYKGTVIALEGPPGIGKCLGRDTEILLYNGQVKYVQDITTKDLLMGPDGTPRYVLNTVTGIEKMYKIVNKDTKEFYRVNRSHILSLKHIFTNNILNINVENFIKQPNNIKMQYKGYKTYIKSFNIPIDQVLEYSENNLRELVDSENLSLIKLNSISHRIFALKYALGKYGYMSKILNYGYIFHSNYTFILDMQFLMRSLGIKCEISEERINEKYKLKASHYNWESIFNHEIFDTHLDVSNRDTTYNIDIIEEENDEYFGFEITDNHLFVLGDFSVTHNTRICTALSNILNLPMEQISLGGMTDPALLLGHSETYIGAKPGRIAHILKKTECMNPIIYLDECDKIGNDYNSTSMYGILTHLLDEEQNDKFIDNYFENIPFDLSKVFFILSYNDPLKLDSIVKNRMKVIKLNGLSIDEKIEITNTIIIPELVKKILQTKDYSLLITKDVLKYIIVNKTEQEPGMRNIKKNLETIINRINSLIILSKCKNKDDIVSNFNHGKIQLNFNNNNIEITNELVDCILTKKRKREDWENMYI